MINEGENVLSKLNDANDAKKKSEGNQTGEEKEPHKNLVALLISAYTVVVLFFGAYCLISIWPTTPEELASNATSTVTLRGTEYSFSLGSETLVILVMIIAGAIGACVFSLYAVAHHLGRLHDFQVRWTAWYFLRPFIGAGLAMIFYFLIRGGVLTVGTSLQNLNLIVVAGLSGLVGMFSEQALRKTRDVADTIFGSIPRNEEETARSTSSDKPKEEAKAPN